MLKRYFHDIQIAFETLLANKLKSGLTALGILFGVAAVISMLAIGSGAQKEIIKQIELIGGNNIIIEAQKQSNVTGDNGDEDSGDNNKSKKFSFGLNQSDYNAILEVVPTVDKISAEIILDSEVLFADRKMKVQNIGISNDYFDIYNLKLQKGSYFNQSQQEEGEPVCIIGSSVKSRLFSKEDPIGKTIKSGAINLKVVGVLKNESLGGQSLDQYGFNKVNQAVFMPQKTMILRVRNREALYYKPSRGQSYRIFIGGNVLSSSSGGESQNYNQFDRLIVKVNKTEQLTQSAALIERILLRKHNGQKDFEIIVPEKLLEQKQRTNDIFNFVLAAIAGISLLVGGIGIMNIMFATVMERIKEIGIRMAIGAKKKDILVQFLTEAVFIGVFGGILGIILGFVLSGLIERLAEIETVITFGSVFIAFVVSVSVGIIFGYTPAKNAANKDPIESLRHE
jgi:putative ABC transport system permease protein